MLIYLLLLTNLFYFYIRKIESHKNYINIYIQLKFIWSIYC